MVEKLGCVKPWDSKKNHFPVMHRSSLLPPASWSVNEIVISQSMLPCNGLPDAFSPPFMVPQHTPVEPGKFSQTLLLGHSQDQPGGAVQTCWTMHLLKTVPAWYSL